MAQKIKLCKETGCTNQQTTLQYCRLHYLKNWKRLRLERKQKAARNLNRYIENILRADPDHGVKALREKLGQRAELEGAVEDVFYQDSVREAMQELGYSRELDHMIDSIKIDEGF